MSNPANRISVILDASVVALARELAQDINEPATIVKNYGFTGLDDPQWIALQNTPEFIALLNSQIQEWNDANSTPKRVKLKAAAAVEMLIPIIAAEVANPDVKLSDRVEGAKLLAALAGFKDNSQATTVPTVSLTINMQGAKQVIDVDP